MRGVKNDSSSNYRMVMDSSPSRFRIGYSAMVLRYRVSCLRLYLIRSGIGSRVYQQFRSRKTAHRWSTAYQIVHGSITLGHLRQLKNGTDQDGSTWYQREWDPGGPDEEYARVSEPIQSNAVKLGGPGLKYAEEGYGPHDPRRPPNFNSIPISKHVHGAAIDCVLSWRKLGGPWSARTEQLVARFGLQRPQPDEEWHFELAPGKDIQALRELFRK